LIFGSSTLQCI